MGIALTSAYLSKAELSDKLYPWNTQNQEYMITISEDDAERTLLTSKILERNEHSVLAYNVMARAAYQSGDFGSLIQYKNHIFDIAPFAYEEYEEYCYMLINGIMLYREAGDESSSQICMEELLNTKTRLDELSSHLSQLGSQIVAQPKTELPEAIQEYIEAIEEELP